MKVKVKFFASYREIVGQHEITMDLKQGTKLSDLVEDLKRLYPRLQGFTDPIVTSVNKKYARDDVMLKDGDEIALLPPVSGG
ncbi:MAG: molybdopterin converting factor subunit 1 [Methanomassiliicoccales archaeon]|nr:molybdopterin converting factor subunit 1 [Methanomassiliicoccales archaeon]